MESVSIAGDVGARIAEVIPKDATICVGLSGGLDSTVLLSVIARHLADAGRVTALHVHHGLSPNAEQWVKFCERLCANEGVPLTIERVRVDPTSPLGMEGAARVARYAAYAARPERYIALAHHLDDQAETVLMQLLRGTGMRGIAAMPELRELRGTNVHIFRPLLAFSRAALRKFAEEEGLRWVEDESNATTGPNRNFLRLDVAPLFDTRYPGWREALARFARHAGCASDLLEALATLDGVPTQPGAPLPLNAALDAERRANALRAFLARNAIAMPTEARLEDMSRQLYEARDDARVRIDHGAVSIVRHKGEAMIDRHLEPPVHREQRTGPWRVDWNRESEVDLGETRGVVCFDPVVGEGIAQSALGEGPWYFAPRSGGETMRIGGADRPTRTLKNLLQERDIPVWQRDFPLLFRGERLVWAPGVGIAADYACAEGQPGLRPTWRVAGKTPLC
jgi:tRNA(Ile)-lysidine synthase